MVVNLRRLVEDGEDGEEEGRKAPVVLVVAVLVFGMVRASVISPRPPCPSLTLPPVCVRLPVCFTVSFPSLLVPFLLFPDAGNLMALPVFSSIRHLYACLSSVLSEGFDGGAESTPVCPAN